MTVTVMMRIIWTRVDERWIWLVVVLVVTGIGLDFCCPRVRGCHARIGLGP